MEPKNNSHQMTTNDPSYPARLTTESDLNGADIFSTFSSTLRNLATANMSAFSSNATPQTLQFPSNSNGWPTSTNNWFDQAKLSSLLPMYGLLPSGTTNDIITQNAFPFMFNQQNSQFATSTADEIAAAVPFNRMETFQATPKSQTLDDSGQYMHSRTYSHSTASTSQTPLSHAPLSHYQQTVSPEEAIDVQKGLNNVQGLDEFNEFDLHDFEELMNKPSTSSMRHDSNENVYSKAQGEAEKLSDPSPLPYRFDELANADKELDRLVSSLVASQSYTHIETAENTGSNAIFRPANLMSMPHSNNLGSFNSTVSLDIPQFTPPDSPTNFGRPNANEIFNNSQQMQKSAEFIATHQNNQLADRFLLPKKEPAQTIEKKTRKSSNQNESLSLIPAETIKVDPVRISKLAMTRKKNTDRVPIYKQGGSSFSRLSFDAFKSEFSEATNSVDDAYSFDDELEQTILSTPEMPSSHLSSSVEQPAAKIKRKYTRRSDAMPTNTSTEHIAPHKEAKSTHGPILAEQIQNRRTKDGFLNSEIANDDNVAFSDIPICYSKESSFVKPAQEDTKPELAPLPKLIIRIPRRESKEDSNGPIDFESFESGRKKKKKHRKNKDVDWTETEECRFAKHKRHKEKKHKKEHKKSKERSISFDEINIGNASEDHVELKETNTIAEQNEDALFLKKLHYFERPTERPRRGTFLLSKKELFADCALWRIDSQNLLQKYLPLTMSDGTICYQNSQTYSGWCENYVDDYLAIKVDYIKQSRSENIVRPLYPLAELFPAINMMISIEEQKKLTLKVEESPVCNKDQQLWHHLQNYIQLMLKHCITLQFITTVKQSNDWNFLNALTHIDLQINKCLECVHSEQPNWSAPFVDSLRNFPKIFIIRDLGIDVDREQSCQACLVKSSEVQHVIQLFAEEIYDPETLVPKRINNYDSSTCTIDFYVCSRCCDGASKYHKIYHVRYSIFKACESKIESVSAECLELLPNQVIEKCAADTKWKNKVCSEACEALQLK